METPVRRMTRSQTTGSSGGPASAVKPPAPPSSTKIKASRRALSDLTNDSPISGLMPLSMSSNAGCMYESTPRSKLRPADCSRGEDVLRNQVTNLLKKVEASGVVKFSLPPNLPQDAEAFESPMRLAAPTPANTPATGSWPSAQEIVTLKPVSSLKPSPTPIPIASPVCHLEICLPLSKCCTHEEIPLPTFKIREINSRPLEVMDEDIIEVQSTTRTLQFDSPEKNGESTPTEEDPSTRTLLFDSPQKSTLEVVDASSPSSPQDDEDDCGWSVIVNVNSPVTKIDSGVHEDFATMRSANNVLVEALSGETAAIWARRTTPRKETEEDDYEECDDYESYCDEDVGAEDASGAFDDACEELCRGLSTISMGEGEMKGLPEFQGKHVRFNYNSEDEIEEELVKDKKLNSPSKMKLKGFPTPRGKHLRFSDDQEE